MYLQIYLHIYLKIYMQIYLHIYLCMYLTMHELMSAPPRRPVGSPASPYPGALCPWGPDRPAAGNYHWVL